jgi:hypothetical protein
MIERVVSVSYLDSSSNPLIFVNHYLWTSSKSSHQSYQSDAFVAEEISEAKIYFNKRPQVR